MYTIQPYTFQQAKKLGVSIYPSSLKGKKIDVFKNNHKIASIGDLRYSDYPTFLKTKGKEYAEERRNAYKKRHQKNRMIQGSTGYYADQLLW